MHRRGDAEVRLQPLLRRRVAALGPPGEAWAASLPSLLGELESRWGIAVGRGLPGGSAAYVAAATDGEGRSLVVKVGLPAGAQGLDGEAAVLRAAGGRGYARLLHRAADLDAIGLERLGASLQSRTTAPEAVLDLLVDTLREAWTIDAAGWPTPTPGEGRAEALHRMIREVDDRLGGVVDPAVRARALAFAELRAAAHDAGGCVVGHGDPHPGNCLQVLEPRAGGVDAPSGYAFVDPDGVLVEPAHDLGVTLREWTRHLDGPDARAVLERLTDRVAARAGVDAQSVWEWAFIERVTTALHVLTFGADRIGLPMLATARRLL